MDHRQRCRVATEGQALVCERHNARRAGQQMLCNPLGLAVGPDEDGDVPFGKPVFKRLPDAVHHPVADRLEARIGRFLLEDLHLHATGKVLLGVLCDIRVHVGQTVAQARRQGGIDAVVEVHNLRSAPPVGADDALIERLRHAASGIRQSGGQAGRVVRHQPRQGLQLAVVAVAPAVDGLLGIADHQRQFSVAQRLPHRDGEVLPLGHGRVLEFVDENVVVALARPLEDVRRGVLPDHFGDHPVQRAQRAHVVVALDRKLGGAQCGQRPHERQPPGQHLFRPVSAPRLARTHGRLHGCQCLQSGVERRNRRLAGLVVFLGPQPLLEAPRQGRRRAGRLAAHEPREPTLGHPFPRKQGADIRRVQRGRQRRGFRLERLPLFLDLPPAPVLHSEKVRGTPTLQNVQQGLHLFEVNRTANVEQLPAHLRIPVVLHRLLDETAEQFSQVAVPSQRLQHPVDGRFQQAGRIQFNGEIVLELKLRREPAHQPPHEFVEGHDGEFAVMPVQGLAQSPRPAPQFLHVQPGFRRQPSRVVTAFRRFRQHLELLHDPVLHLLRRLVGEGQSEDAAEGKRLSGGQAACEVGLHELEGLAAASGRPQHPESLDGLLLLHGRGHAVKFVRPHPSTQARCPF